MFSWYYATSALNYAKELPREVTIGIAAYFILTDLYEKHTSVRVAETKATTRNAELEVEALKLKLKLKEAEARSMI